MKKFLATLCVLFVFCAVLHSQTPVVQWEKLITGLNPSLRTDIMTGQVLYGMARINSGGLILVGGDSLFGVNRKNLDATAQNSIGIVTRVDSAGNRIWNYRANFQSVYTSVLSDQNSLFITGMTHDMNRTNNSIYLTKRKLSGALEWFKTYGGNGNETAFSAVTAHDSGYVVVGSTNSTDGDVIGNTGGEDIWILKIGDYSGSLLWQKCIGGQGNQRGYSICTSLDEGYVIAGCDSASGPFNGLLLKIDANGNQMWKKGFGGTGSEILKAILPLADVGYIAIGHTYSNDGDITGNHGDADVWAIKVDASGNKIWSKCYGGSREDYGSAIERTEDGGFLISGHTSSNDGDVTEHKGLDDMWLIKIDGNGNLIWQKTFGGPLNEYGAAVTSVSDNTIYVAVSKNPNFVYNPATTFLYKLGNANTLKGMVFLDKNLDGNKGADEPFVSNVTVQSQKQDQILSAIPNNNGAFKILVDTGTYQTTVLANSNYYNVVPTSVSSSFSNYFNTDSFNFALQPIPGKKDLMVSLMGISPLRPGFDASHKIIYRNQGTETISAGTVQLVKSNQLNFVSATPIPTSINGDTLRWNFTNLLISDSATIYINSTVTPPPAVNNGDVLNSIATIIPVIEDITPLDNSSRLLQTVTGSYDPNDKKEIHNGKLNPEQVTNGEWLQYTIRFQNVGSDTAFNIVVRDTLSTKVDLSTLQMISASHSYNLNIKEGNKLTWTFSNILLVDSITNEPLSHGYINYRIRPLNTLVKGDTILNSASIYFDFNLPVITNKEQTLVLEEVLPVNLLTFTAQKKGDKNLLQWRTGHEENTSHFEVEKSDDGKNFKQLAIIATTGSSSSYKITDDNPLPANNYYRLKMFDKDGTHIYSPIRLINNSFGITGISLYPNPVKEYVTLKMHSSKNEILLIEVVNVDGKVISTQKVDLNEGANTRILNIANLQKGIYFIRMITNNEQVAMKIEKL